MEEAEAAQQQPPRHFTPQPRQHFSSGKTADPAGPAIRAARVAATATIAVDAVAEAAVAADVFAAVAAVVAARGSGGGGGDRRPGRDLPARLQKYASPRPFAPRPFQPAEESAEPPSDYTPVILPGEVRWPSTKIALPKQRCVSC